MTSRSLVAWAGLALIPACSVDSPAESTTEQAVEDGTIDATNRFPGVGQLLINSTRRCTGTLVAPDKVLTAKHCIEGASSAPMRFAPRTDARVISPADFRVKEVRVPDYFADGHDIDFWFDYDDVTHDVAILVLDRPVPIDVARPHPVAGVNNAPNCQFPSDGHGVIVGYAPEDGDYGGMRRFGSSHDWEYNAADNTPSGAWQNSFFALGAQTGAIREGDSGGPVFAGEPVGHAADPAAICGVGSATLWNFPAEAVATYAATQVGAVREFLQRELAGVRYDCWVPPGQGGDGDGDQVHDMCDRCPSVADSSQLDSDKDGRGDACDNCPTLYNPGFANQATFGQLDHDPLRDAFDPVPGPALPGTFVKDPTWNEKYPGDVCNPHPVTIVKPLPGRTYSGGRYLEQPYHFACPGASSHGTLTLPPAIDNVLLATSFVGGAQTQLGNTRIAVCDCPSSDDKQCMATWCPRGDIEHMPGQWRIPTLYDAQTNAQLTNQPFYSADAIATKHVARAPNDLLPNKPIIRPAPQVRELAWAYWDDYASLPAPSVGTHPVADVMVWAWTKNYGSTAASPWDATTSPGYLARRQSYTRLSLSEQWAPLPVGSCRETWLGVPIDRGHRIPNLGDCPMCGRFAGVRVPGYGTLRPLEYAAPHTAVRGLSQVMTAQLESLLADEDVAVATASDAVLAPGGALSTVYRRSTHDVLGTIAIDENGLLAFTELALPANNVIEISLPDAAAMSAGRQEITFFDTFSYENFDFLAMRTADLATSAEYRSRVFPVANLDGAIAAVGYRSQDDSYFMLTRSKTSVRVFRVSAQLSVREVLKFDVAGVKVDVDLHIGEDGTIAITRRGANEFEVAVVEIDATTLDVTPLAHLTGAGRLTLGATVTPEGLILERTTTQGTLSVYPLVQQGEPDVVYHPVANGAWLEMFL